MFKFKVRPGCGSHEQNHPEKEGVNKTFFPGEVFESESDLRVPGFPPEAQKFELVSADTEPKKAVTEK